MFLLFSLFLSLTLSLFHLQDQLIAELERLQLELDQLRARPGGSYSRSVYTSSTRERMKVSGLTASDCQDAGVMSLILSDAVDKSLHTGGV